MFPFFEYYVFYLPPQLSQHTSTSKGPIATRTRGAKTAHKDVIRSGRVTKLKGKNSLSKKNSSHKGANVTTTPKSRTTKITGKKDPKRKAADEFRTDENETPEKYNGTLKLNDRHIMNKYLEVREAGDKCLGVLTRVISQYPGWYFALARTCAFVCSQR